MRVMRALVPALAACLFLVAVNTRADDEPSERDRKVARESVYQGDDYVKKGDYARALDAYRRANAIMKVPTTSIEVVRTSLKLGLLVEALEACRQTAAHPPKAGEPEPFTKARSEARDLMAGLVQLIPRLTVAVLAPEGAPVQVVIDDKAVADHVRLPLNPGKHSIVASAPGLVSAHAEVELGEGENRRVELVLKGAVSTVVTKGPATYWPLVFTGFGLTAAGVAGGAVTGVLSLQAADELAGSCRDDGSCPPDKGLQPTIDRRNTLGYLSTGAFALAGVGMVIAVPSLVVSLRARKDMPKESEKAGVLVAPLFTPSGSLAAGATLVGSF